MQFSEFEANTIADGYSPDPRHRNLLLPVPEHAPDIAYGKITPDIAAACGMRPLPVCLANGRHHTYGGFGVAHILGKHGDEIAHWNYHSVQDFVDHTAQTFDAVYRARDQRFILVSRTLRNPTMNRLLVVELGRTGDHYTVIAGWLASASRPVRGDLVAERAQKSGVLVWECRAPHLEGPGRPSPA